jgi:plasmid stabilization system protein ParE
MSGHVVSEYESKDIREVIEKPYRIIYRIKSDQIDILAIAHCSQRLTSTKN